MADVDTRQEDPEVVVVPQWRAASRKYVVEVIGTFFLVFTVAASGYIHSTFTPLAAGAVLMVMVYAGGTSPAATTTRP